MLAAALFVVRKLTSSTPPPPPPPLDSYTINIHTSTFTINVDPVAQQWSFAGTATWAPITNYLTFKRQIDENIATPGKNEEVLAKIFFGTQPRIYTVALLGLPTKFRWNPTIADFSWLIPFQFDPKTGSFTNQEGPTPDNSNIIHIEDVPAFIIKLRQKDYAGAAAALEIKQETLTLKGTSYPVTTWEKTGYFSYQGKIVLTKNKKAAQDWETFKKLSEDDKIALLNATADTQKAAQEMANFASALEALASK